MAKVRHPPASPWLGRSVLITAGPTREYLDPVRFLTNASSGMMGFALAKAARDLGARVTVISGPTRITMPWGVKVLHVTTAEQMFRKALAVFRRADVFIGAAAVSDWKFARQAAQKIKKTGEPLELTLLPNPDILTELGRLRRARRPVLVGFALETNRWLSHAREKLKRKGIDLIVANRIHSLGMEKTRVALIRPRGRARVLPPLPKGRAAREILRSVSELLNGGA